MNQIKTLEEALDFAIKREQHSVELYHNRAIQEENEHLRDLMFGFATEKRAHKLKLEIIKKNHAVSAFKNDHELFFSEVIHEKPFKNHPVDLKELLLFAIALEKDSILFYMNMAKSFRNPDLKAFFTSLAREEGDHLQQIESMYTHRIEKTSRPS